MGRMECLILPRSLDHGRYRPRAPGFPVRRGRRSPSAQARLHALEDILLIATLAVIGGADRGTEVELFGHPKQVWLETFLALPHGIPSHDTFGRVLARLDPEQREVCFTRWVQSLAASLRDPVVSVGGKAARRSHDAVRGLGLTRVGKAPIRIFVPKRSYPVGGSTHCIPSGGSGPGRGCSQTRAQA